MNNELEFQQARLNEIVSTYTGRPIVVVLEGRDSAGKSGTIRELTHFLPTKEFAIVTTNKPTKAQMASWLAWWSTRIPANTMITLCDRSWYSRALVQSVNGWCTSKQYQNFMGRVNDWEKEQNCLIIKFWLSISQQEQSARLTDRKTSKLRGWKYSNNDAMALTQYDKMSLAKENLFTASGQEWNVIDYNNKAKGRVDMITRLCDILQQLN
jgi:polyphosphate kinase 2 (PPK2 family)